MKKKQNKNKDRLLGSLIGLAVGDAVGTTLEFSPRDCYEALTDMVGGGPFDLKPGEWTDDTSMALCLAKSLVDKKDFDAEDQMKNYCKWRYEGFMSSNGVCFDIGNTTSMALSEFNFTGDPFCGPKDERSSGNGSIMRLAPIPIFYSDNIDDTVKFSAMSSKTTHGSELCVDSCKFLGALLYSAFNGSTKEALLSPDLGFTFKFSVVSPEVNKIIEGSYKSKNRGSIKSSGFVIDTLEAALWAFYNTENFKEGLLLAVNLGDDSDTVGAVYGQIAGAYYGLTGIPTEWVKKLARVNDILKLGEDLLG